jgi:4-amino-4-deoxy-L-arabinose transferase-like glycosyltransferase
MKHGLIIVPLGGLVLSLIASFLIYGLVAPDLGNSRVTDRYDDLAQGLVHYRTLSYYPDTEPTVWRTPLFPAVLALGVILNRDSFTAIDLILQSVLHGLTVLVAYKLAESLRGRRSATIAGIIVAIHPLLLWYSSRLVVETLLTFLVTLSVLLLVNYWKKPSTKTALLLGLTIGLGLWCKAVFVFLEVLAPLLLFWRHSTRRTRDAMLAFSIALIAFSPWLARNYALTGRFPLFQALVGYNLYVSDSFVKNAMDSPFGYRVLIEEIDFREMDKYFQPEGSSQSLAEREAHADVLLTRRSVRHYLQEPAFLVKKVLLNAFWFWCLGSNTRATILLLALQGPLLWFAIRTARRVVHGSGWRHAALIPLWVAIIFAVPHILVFSLGRFSVPLVPSLICAAFARANPLSESPPGTRGSRRTLKVACLHTIPRLIRYFVPRHTDGANRSLRAGVRSRFPGLASAGYGST